MGPGGWHAGGPFIGLVFGLAGMAFGFTAMCFAFWRRQRRETSALEVLRTYAAQGKEPPAEVAALLQSVFQRDRRGRDLRNAIFFACLAAAFAALYFFSEGARPHHGLIFPVVIFAALAVWSALSALLFRRHDER